MILWVSIVSLKHVDFGEDMCLHVNLPESISLLVIHGRIENEVLVINICIYP